MKVWRSISLMVLVGLTTAACRPGSLFGATTTATPTVTPSSTPEPTPTPTSRFTPTWTQTPGPTYTPIGGSGKLLVGALICDPFDSDNCTQHIYLYDLSLGRATISLDDYFLEGLSPDGTRLLVSLVGKDSLYDIERPGELYLTDLDGSNPVLLSSSFIHRENLSAAWLPETDLIAFLGTDNDRTEVFTIHPDGSGLSQVTQSVEGVGHFLPRLIYGEIYWEEGIGDYRYGWNRTTLDGAITRDIDDWWDLKVSPDGKFVAYLKNWSVPKNYCYACELAISRADGTGTAIISVAELIGYTDLDQIPNFRGYFWFPDSQRILAQVLTFDTKGHEIYNHFVFSTSGEYLEKLDVEQLILGDWSWSPDWQQFAYIYYKMGGGRSMRVPEILDFGTMQTRDVDPDFFNDLHPYVILWLPY